MSLSRNGTHTLDILFPLLGCSSRRPSFCDQRTRSESAWSAGCLFHWLWAVVRNVREHRCAVLSRRDSGMGDKVLGLVLSSILVVLGNSYQRVTCFLPFELFAKPKSGKLPFDVSGNNSNDRRDLLRMDLVQSGRLAAKTVDSIHEF